MLCSSANAGVVSDKIRLNSLGFVPRIAKQATIAAKCSTVNVVSSADKKIVFSGMANGPFKSPDTGEELYTFDFSPVVKSGTYYIQALGVGRSADFIISNGAYDMAFYVMMRGMYLWRCGCAVSSVYKGVTYSHTACHMDDACLDETGSSGKQDATGGWHDAGDYGKYTVNAGISVGIMLKAWEQFGDNIKKIGLDIPKLNSVMPDFLSEIQWETDWLIKMQASNGSVYHKVSTLSFSGEVMPDKDTQRRYFADYSTAATADFAAVLSEAAVNFLPYDPQLSARYINAARRAMDFLEANPSNHYSNQQAFSTGKYDTSDTDDRLWAYACMWDATGEEKYLKEFEKEAAQFKVKIDADWDWGNVKNLAMLSYLFSTRPGKDKIIEADIRHGLISCADSITTTAAQDPYSRPLGSVYYWGSNGTVARQALVLFSADKISPNPAYVNTASDAIAHLFGRNYYNRSLVTGLGINPPMHTHDRRSMTMAGVAPWPGYLVGGGLTATSWKDDKSSFTTNEIAINWNSALIYAIAGFVSGEGFAAPDNTAEADFPKEDAKGEIAGLIYDGKTAGYTAQSLSFTAGSGVKKVKGGDIELPFKGGAEEQITIALKNPLKLAGYNYIEFDIKALKAATDAIYFGINADASYDKLLDIGGFIKPVAQWRKIRLPLEEMSTYGQEMMSEIVFVTQQKHRASFLINNIFLINYTPPTATISPTFTVSPVVSATATPSATQTATKTVFATPTFTQTATLTNTASPSFTPTATATIETGYKLVVDNFSNEGPLNMLSGSWYTYNDANDGGTSTIKPAPAEKFSKDSPGRTGNGRIVSVKGSVTTVFQWGYVGVGTMLDRDRKSFDLNGCKGLRFWYKGDGKAYRIKLVSKHPDFKNGGSDNHYGAEFTTGSGWQKFEMDFSDFTQEPYWGSKVEQDKAFSEVTDIQWQTKGQPYDSVELALDGIEIYGCAAEVHAKP